MSQVISGITRVAASGITGEVIGMVNPGITLKVTGDITGRVI